MPNSAGDSGLWIHPRPRESGASAGWPCRSGQVLSASFKVRNNEVGRCIGARHETIVGKPSCMDGSIGMAEHKPPSGKLNMPFGTQTFLRFAARKKAKASDTQSRSG